MQKIPNNQLLVNPEETDYIPGYKAASMDVSRQGSVLIVGPISP
jgi:hypothetical protein